MAAVRIYIHPTCMTSYKLVKKLYEEDLLGKVELVDTSLVAPSRVLERGVWSVPWVTVKGAPAATDPVDPDEVVEIIMEGRGHLPHDPAERFMETVLHSMYASSLVYMHGSLKPVYSPNLASAAARSPLGGPEPSTVLRAVAEREEELLDRWIDAIMRVLGIGYVRTLWWAAGGGPGELEPPSQTQVAVWLLSAASMGRVGLPWRPYLDSGRVRRLATFIEKGFKGLLNKVAREQETIMGDEEYWEILEHHASPA